MPVVRWFFSKRIAVLRLYGPIAGGTGTAEWIEQVRRLRESRRVAAVVLDIDSPGGSATASDDAFLAVARLAAAKPVVAAIRGTGASGAYLVAMAAQTVLTQPHAIVGSIGVIAASPHLPRLLDRLGVTVNENRAGHLKGMGAPWREETDEELAKEQAIVDAFYDAFVDRVAHGRRLTEERVRELATGEVWLGQQAVELGLVDAVGDLERAIEVADAAAGIPARSARVRVRQPLLARLAGYFAASVIGAVADEVEARLQRRLRT